MTITELRRSEHLPRPYDDWRILKEPCVGQVNGLATFRGLAFATNGIIVAIRTTANKVLFGHLEWFVKDKKEQQTDLDEFLVPAKRRSKRHDALAEFTEAL